MAAAAGCPLVYSLNRERSPYNTELVSVSEALAEHYRLTEVPVLDTDYTSAMKKPPKKNAMAEAIGARLPPPRRPARSVARGHARGAAGGAAGPPAPAAGGSRASCSGMTLYNNAAHLPQAHRVRCWRRPCARLHAGAARRRVDGRDRSGGAPLRGARSARALRPACRAAGDDRHLARGGGAGRARVARRPSISPGSATTTAGTRAGSSAWCPSSTPIPARCWRIRSPAAMEQAGEELEKGPRLFDTATRDGRCRTAGGASATTASASGDMVYGLMRLGALRRAGIFRRVLRPDRLLMTELTLQGRIRQVPEVLWFRRQSTGTSVERQRTTLVLPGDEPRWFFAAAVAAAHARPVAGVRDDAARRRARCRARARGSAMLLRFQLTYGWRHFRKTSASHAIGRGINRVGPGAEAGEAPLSPRGLPHARRGPRPARPAAPRVQAWSLRSPHADAPARAAAAARVAPVVTILDIAA